MHGPELPELPSDETTVYPTHTCFDDAIEILIKMVDGKDPALSNIRVVHGIARSPETGKLFAHAWVEADLKGEPHCFFIGVLQGERCYFAADREEYRDDMKVVESTEYDVEAVILENFASGHYGPWVERYQALCRT